MAEYKTTYKVDEKRILEAAKFKLKYKDNFDPNTLLGMIAGWLLEYGWAAEGETDDDFKETFEILYFEKIDDKGVKEVQQRWRASKIPHASSYFKFHLGIDFRYLALKPVELVKEGKKISTLKGDLEITVEAVIELDPHKHFTEGKFLSFIRGLVKDKVYKKEIEQHKLELYREAYILQNVIKQWFNFVRANPYEEIKHFHAMGAYPSHKIG